MQPAMRSKFSRYFEYRWVGGGDARFDLLLERTESLKCRLRSFPLILCGGQFVFDGFQIC